MYKKGDRVAVEGLHKRTATLLCLGYKGERAATLYGPRV